MGKVIAVAYNDEDYETYFKLYSYTPAIIDVLKEDLKEYLLSQGFHLSTIKEWERWNDDSDNEEWKDSTPVYSSLIECFPREDEITWENIVENDEMYVTDQYNITVRIWKEEVVEVVESFDFDKE